MKRIASSSLLRISLGLVPAVLLAACELQDQPSACCQADPAAVHAESEPAPAPEPAMLPDDSLLQLTSTWTTDEGATLQLNELSGQMLVVGMVFTHCEYACPVIVNDMKRIDAALPESARPNVRYVLVTFDLDRDTPQVLRGFRLRMGLPADRWTLVRGQTEDDTLELAALLGVKYKADARGQFAHSNVLSVLDGEGRLVHQQVGLSASVDQTVAYVCGRKAEPGPPNPAGTSGATPR